MIPDVELYPIPVMPNQSVPLPVLTEEYTKYLAAISGLTTILPERDQILPRRGSVG